MEKFLDTIRSENFGDFDIEHMSAPGKSTSISLRRERRVFEIEITKTGEVYVTTAIPENPPLPFDGHDRQVEPDLEKLAPEVIAFLRG